MELARRYLAKCPPAISGQGGHDATFHVASVLVNGFTLGEQDALTLLREWNAGCQPPWSEAELAHKVRSAANAQTSKPRGWMLAENPKYAKQPTLAPPRVLEASAPIQKPDRSGFNSGDAARIATLARLRPYHWEGLALAQKRGLLVFGDWYGLECYGVTDRTGSVLELRRVDEKLFPKTEKLDARKSHAVRGSRKSWPVGILEAKDFPCIALVEGIPDFLEAHYVTLWEDLEQRCAPVAMLSACPAIAEEALPHFAGKRVRVFPHLDKAGLQGAAKWVAQLREAGAAKVDIFDFSRYRQPDGAMVTDLYEALHADCKLPERMLP